MARYLSFVETWGLARWQSDLQLYEFRGLEGPLKRLYYKFVTACQSLLVDSQGRLGREIVSQGVILAHIVKNNQSVLGFLWIHLLEIDVFNRKEHFRPDLAGGISLTNDRSVDSGGPCSAFEDTTTADPQLYRLDLFVEIEYMHQHLEIVHLCDKRLIEAVNIVVLACQKEMRRILYFEDLFELPLVVLHLCFVVDLDRAHIVQLNGESQRS